MSDQPKLPIIKPEDIQKIAEKVKAGLAAHEPDDQDKRELKGKYYPGDAVCRICTVGTIVPNIRFPSNKIIGGRPSQGYVDHWFCQKCGLMYHHLPK
jgi:hypothetical protein